MSDQLKIRPMLIADLTVVLGIEQAAYTTIAPETREALGSKLLIAADSCWVACSNDNIVGYLIALPWNVRAAPPVLNEATLELPLIRDTLYVHDLAIKPKSRRLGVGAALVRHAQDFAQQASLKYSTLIAVQDSSPYWAQFGYRTVRDPQPNISEKLLSYGDSAVYMQKEL